MQGVLFLQDFELFLEDLFTGSLYAFVVYDFRVALYVVMLAVYGVLFGFAMLAVIVVNQLAVGGQHWVARGLSVSQCNKVWRYHQSFTTTHSNSMARLSVAGAPPRTFGAPSSRASTSLRGLRALSFGLGPLL